jgi:hypothetical protein
MVENFVHKIADTKTAPSAKHGGRHIFPADEGEEERARWSNVYQCVAASDDMQMEFFRLLCKCEKNFATCKVCNWRCVSVPVFDLGHDDISLNH